MRLPVLDDRLARAAALFPACAYGADIGADHGRLSCILLANNVCQRMCVSDLSADSLKKARTLLERHGVADRADFREGNGLSVLDHPADAAAILGMGGRTLTNILLWGQSKLQNAALILSAHTELLLLRQTVSDIGYHIDREEIAFAGGRFYVVMRALPGKETYSLRQLLLGPRLMEGSPEHYREYLAWRLSVVSCARGEDAETGLKWLKEEQERVCDRTAD